MKKEKEKKNKKVVRGKRTEKGITLIALVITIAILIILSTVTIAVVFGEGGLIQRAEQAKSMTEEAKIKEEQEILNLLEEYNKILDETISEKEAGVIAVENDNILVDFNTQDVVKINASIEKGDGTLKYEVIEGNDLITVDQAGNVTIYDRGTAKVKVIMEETEKFAESNSIVVTFTISGGVTIKDKIEKNYTNSDNLEESIDLKEYISGKIGSCEYRLPSESSIYINPTISEDGILTYSINNPSVGNHSMYIEINIKNAGTFELMISSTVGNSVSLNIPGL